MSTPLWQLLIDWVIKALAPLATFLAVLVALFGSRLRNWATPPQLTISLASADGWPALLHTFDHTTNTTGQTEGIWYHVRVDNRARWSPVSGVHIFLLSIEAPDASGAFRLFWEGYAPLGWRHEPDPKPKTVGYRAQCDLCHVLNAPREARLSPLIKGQIPDLFTGPFKIAVTLQARGIEADFNTSAP